MRHRLPPVSAQTTLVAPFAGTVVAVPTPVNQTVSAGTTVAVIEAMKMEHEVIAEHDATVTDVRVAVGETVAEGQPLVVLAAGGSPAVSARPEPPTPAGPRDDLQAVRDRHAVGLDAARPDAVAKRHDQGRRTARENLADLLDPDSFVEYGPLMFAAQERRRSKQELIERTPADGLVGGVGAIAGEPCVAMSYDYTVLAGTQGMRNHQKKDRLFELAQRRRLPVVLFAEGGGGRPGDVDMPIVAGLDCRAFQYFAQLSGLVPLVGIASGYCFAGNAALLGCCDVVIATEDASIGMGGPAMIEGGGLGSHHPAEVGPIDVQYANGVVDLRVAGDAQAVAAAQRYLGYFRAHPAPAAPTPPDQTLLRDLIPANRGRVYAVRDVISGLLEDVLELRAGFGPGMVTALARLDGRPLGVIANDPTHLGGAIDADGADKAARFMQLCDAFGLPLLFLADTPGFMVGPEAEKTATVRRCSRMFVTGANLPCPPARWCCARATGWAPRRWPAAASRRRCSASAGRRRSSAGWAWRARSSSGCGASSRRSRIRRSASRPTTRRSPPPTSAAAGSAWRPTFEIDDVIDPADTRRWIATLFDDGTPHWSQQPGKRRPFVDTY